MKQLTTIILSLFAISIIFTHCDKIEGDPVDGSLALDELYDSHGRELRKIFLEDYTGQGCGNCPNAAVTSAEHVQDFGKRIVPISVHAGHFANSTFFNYATLGTPEGEAYDIEFGNSGQGNPNGLVNRINNTEDLKVFTPSAWAPAIGSMLTDIAPVTIGIEPTFSSDSTFSVAISGEFITTLSKSYNLVVSILEDSIVAPQKFYSGVQGRTTDVTEYNYVHRHVLRGNLNGIWGTPFAGGEFGNTYNINIPKYTIDATWEKKNLSLVAYVYDTDTKEILHVSETHLMH